MPFTRDVEEFRQHLLELQGRGDFETLLKESATALAEQEIDCPPDATTGELAFLHGNSLLLNCQYDSAETHYQYAAGIFDALGLHERRIQCRLRIARCSMLLADLPRAQFVVEAVAREFPGEIPTALLAEINELLGRIAWRMTQLARAITCLEVSRTAYRECGNEYMALVTSNNLAAIHMEVGNFATADALLAECQEGFSRRGDHRRVWDLKATRALLIYYQGDLAAARAALRDCIADVDRYPDPSAYNRVFYNLAILELLSGDLPEAKRLLLRSSATPQHTKVLAEMGIIQLLLALLALLQRDYAEATNLSNLAQLNISSSNINGRIMLTAIGAILNLVAGNLPAGRKAWSHCIELEPDRPDYFLRPLLRYLLHCFAEAPGTAAALDQDAVAEVSAWLREYDQRAAFWNTAAISQHAGSV